jgi:hypothetical protein
MFYVLSIDETVVHDEVEIMWYEVVVTYSKILLQRLSRTNKENHESPQPRHPVSERDSKTELSDCKAVY